MIEQLLYQELCNINILQKNDKMFVVLKFIVSYFYVLGLSLNWSFIYL